MIVYLLVVVIGMPGFSDARMVMADKPFYLTASECAAAYQDAKPKREWPQYIKSIGCEERHVGISFLQR